MFIRTHKQFFTNLQSITTKSIYKYLQNKIIILNSLTCETYWNRIFQTQLKWNKIWVHNFNSYTQPKIQNILFKIHHRILPTNAFISKWKRHKGSQTPSNLKIYKTPLLIIYNILSIIFIKHIINTKYYYHKRNNDLLEFERLFAINNSLCSLNSNNELQFQI